MSSLLDPRVLDASTLVPKASSALYLPVAVEGEMDNAGDAVVAVSNVINRIDESAAAYGPNSSLHRIVSALLKAGAGPVIATPSSKGAVPNLAARQAAWALQESDDSIRLRLTDSEVQADLVGLAQSCANAELLFNKQIAFVGMPTVTTKANLIAAAAAIAGGAGGVEGATRTCLVGPGVYDDAGTLWGGSFLAAVIAAEVAKNSDPTNDLDLWTLPILTAMEKDVNGMDVFRRKVVGGVAVNDYEDLLQGGVSPVQPSRVPGGVSTTHLRTVYITNGTFDSLYSRVIDDQIFIDVKNYVLDQNFLRAGNTNAVRLRIKSGVEALLVERAAWISPVSQPDGTQGYNVTVTSSPDQRQVTVGYEGVINRGISTIQVAANLSIAV